MNKKIKEFQSEVLRISKMSKVAPYELTNVMFKAETKISEWEIRKMGGFKPLLKAYFPEPADLETIQHVKYENNYLNSLKKQVGTRLVDIKEIVDTLQKIPKIKVSEYVKKPSTKTNRAVNLVLSDLHFGSDVEQSQTGKLTYGKLEEARRFSRIVKEVLDYKTEHRPNTKLNVLLLGDIIQNQLHEQRDGAPLAEQSARAIHLITQAIGMFSQNFPEVEIHCNTGNHGRNTGRHHGRAVNQKWDSIETIIHYAIKTACSNLKNVKFSLPKTPYLQYEVFGNKIFATHGDTVLNVGYPGKAIRTGFLENQINRINASLSDKNEYSVFIVGHVHTASVTHLSNGATLITNGALVPVDEYAVSIGMMESCSGQYLFESVKGFPVGDCRYIKVTEKDDKDKELDSIIKRFDEI